MDFILDVMIFGLPYALIALGVFISYRVLDFADMTTEGSFVLGGAMSLVLIYVGVNPWVATIIAVLSGALTGVITGLLHTKLKINGLLAGIITLTILFSVNMVVFGGALNKGNFNIWTSNSTKVQLTSSQSTIFSVFNFMSSDYRVGVLVMLIILFAVVFALLYFFFGTEVGMSMRAVGMNKKMAQAQGINSDFYIILGLAIANGIIAFAGALYAQRDESFFSTSGTGMLVVGLASIIIGEAIFGKRSFLNWMISVSIGGVIYYAIVYTAIQLGMPDHLLKMLYGLIIVAILGISFANTKLNGKISLTVLIKAIINKIHPKSTEDLVKEHEEAVLVEEEANVAMNSYENVPIEVKDNVMLRVEHVTKKFNRTGNPEDLKIALNDVSVEIKEGEFVTIIGGNGSGKSTFFNTASGVFRPEQGEIWINGDNVTKDKEYQRARYIGRVAQDPYQGTAHDMSILENMNIAYRRDRMKTLCWGFSKKNEQLFKDKLSALGLGLESRMSAKIGTLSGGQRQAVTLLMATLQRPDILFLDEHTAALDPKTAKKVLTLTDSIVKENKLTCVMVTHNMRDAIKYGNRLLMFNNGKIIYDVSGEEKANLTVEDLLKKFENVDFNDSNVLG